MTEVPIIYWLGNDLRLADNAALTWAAKQGPVVPIYILDEDKADPYLPGGASKWWLREALLKLSQSYEKIGVPLVLRRGPSAKILYELIKQTGAKTVTWNRRYEPRQRKRDAKIEDDLERHGIEVKIYDDYLLFLPEVIHTKGGTPFKVFTPFSKACFAAKPPAKPLHAPRKIKAGPKCVSDKLNDWRLVPKTALWPAGLAKAWKVGEAGGLKQLKIFTDDILQDYKHGRDRPDKAGTSRMSPYLHFGHISPRQAWHAILQAHNPAHGSSSERYLLELLWREFSWHLLYHIPAMPHAPLTKSFAEFPWRKDSHGLRAWQRGRTGYPIVDAGMRQLWETGWMHNRVRMIVASFLIKDLLVDWRRGAAWFWDTLVDADLGNNSASWQWVAGCGADASPYFRIFNPTRQGIKFDPDGNYVRRYVPELVKFDAKYIHEPWMAPDNVLQKAKIVLGKTYPRPIVDHGDARGRALDALAISKGRKPKSR